MLSKGQIIKYLNRLGIDETSEPTVDFLDELIYAHQKSIPFETIGLHRSDSTPDISVDATFSKIIEKNRGGYCFELNSLFIELLRELGFDARPSLCRAVRGRDVRMPINHKGITVDIEGTKRFADVGFGGPMPSASLDLSTQEEQVIRGERYLAHECDNGWIQIRRTTQGAKDLHDDQCECKQQVELELCTAEVDDIDFESLNLACSQPGTLFRDHELVNLRTDNGHLAYKDGVLTIRENGEKRIEQFDDFDSIDDMLIERFGIDYKGERPISAQQGA